MKWLDLLYRSFDARLSEAEQQRLEDALKADPELRDERQRVLEVRRLLQEHAPQRFSPFFAARVLHRIREQRRQSEDFLGALQWAFRRLAVAGVLALLLLIANQVFVHKQRSLSSIFGPPQPTLEETLALNHPLMEETP